MSGAHDTSGRLRELRELMLLGACTEREAAAAAEIITGKPEMFEHMGITEAVDMSLDLARVRSPQPP